MAVHALTTLRAGRPVAWLAYESNVPATTIARIETGVTRMPSRETWNKLAKALDADASQLELAHVQFVNSQREAA